MAMAVGWLEERDDPDRCGPPIVGLSRGGVCKEELRRGGGVATVSHGDGA